MPKQTIQEALREVLSRPEFRKIPEKEALEAAMDVASEWKMRLDELEAEEEE